MLPRSNGLQLAPSNTGGVLDGRGQRGKEINCASAEEGIHLAPAPADGRSMSVKSVTQRRSARSRERERAKGRDRNLRDRSDAPCRQRRAACC